MTEAYTKVLSNYNNKTIVFQLIIFLTGVYLTIRLYKKPTAQFIKVFKLYLSFCFFWIAIVYFIFFGDPKLNNLISALPFATIAFFWIKEASSNYVLFVNSGNKNLVQFLFILLFLIPVFSFIVGKRLPEMTFFIFPCGLITYTLILLISFSKNTNIYILSLLLMLAVPGGILNLVVFNSWEDFIMLLTGIIAILVFSKKLYDTNKAGCEFEE